MPAEFEFFSRYFWVMAIALTVINVPFLWARTASYRRENPESTRGYARLLLGYTVVMISPWIIMGAGSLFGGAPRFWDYLQPRDGNPFVIAWVLYVAAVSLWVDYWLLKRGGAETLAQHPGILSGHAFAPEAINTILRVWAMASVPLVFVWLVAVWFVDIPAPLG